ncbi:hypothetical protein AAE02nite_51580 [Adhaeribacter aerolatus]|uniref:Transposase IS4-like domain-containing protein n=2 Tax=Adhaeribacter aerolatus TaxID=670289 RepID=A0A512B6A2_9BACT|nr:hypothetical protein AAE02nite_51580 [Adhaeribacter aerolatus]
MDTNGIRVKDLLNYLPAPLLDQLAQATQVDYQVKKLHGKLLFQLLLYGVLTTTRLSLNVLVAVLDSLCFRTFAGLKPDFQTRRNSLADRLAHVQVAYFEQLLQATTALFRRHFPNDQKRPYRINCFDSTTVSCSSKLLAMGMVNGIKPKDESKRLKQIKFTIGFDGLTVSACDLYTQQTYLAEDQALGETIRQSSLQEDEVGVFDRGLKKRKTFRLFSEQGRLFVTRLNSTTMYVPVAVFTSSQGRRTATLELLSDQMVYLYCNGNVLRFPFRLITARSRQSSETLFFLTNLFALPAKEVTAIYRQRWEIECFFRFLKQELNFTHLLSRTTNGIQVTVYITLIAAMLILVYRKLNQMSGFKLVKLRFEQELQTDIIKEIVRLCQGKHQLVDRLVPSG